MADQKVLEAQQWVNATYGSVPGYVRCEENGRTGWPTMYALTRGLQHELGITALSDSFGPATLAALQAREPIVLNGAASNVVRIAQHGLFGKGYSAGATNGIYHVITQAAVQELMGDAGVSSDGFLRAKWFKAILTMDAYVLTTGGSTAVRGIQRWLNARYIDRSTFFAGPCDGHYSRDVQVALMKALQYESFVPDAQVNGNFGPATQASLRNQRVGPGWTGTWVQLFSAACVFNGPVSGLGASFSDAWTSGLTEYVVAFQRFSVLSVTGVADYPTWAQLLVSTGDPDRPASACDTRFHIDEARSRAMYAAGFRVVGRYLDQDPTSTREKKLQPGELTTIFAGGLRMFPISQYTSRSIDDFTYGLGQDHAGRAHDLAVGHGLNPGTVIYFAVDFDATDPQITDKVITYFNGVQYALAQRGRRYVAGVYGSRNVCARVSNEAYARFSFVSGMSYGFSGNLGFPMPANWSFNQIKEFQFTAGTDTFDLDRDVFRPGSDPAVGPENVGATSSPLDAFLTYIDDLYDTAVAYGKGNDPNLRVLEFLRYPNYVDVYDGWQALIGDVDRDWIAFAETAGPSRVLQIQDPSFGVTVGVDHFGATANVNYLLPPNGSTVGRGDFAGWGGDLCTFYGEWQRALSAYPSGYDFCRARLAKLDVDSSFKLNDLIEDADGWSIGSRIHSTGERVNVVIRGYFTGDGHLNRFATFFGRYGSVGAVMDAARAMLIGDFPDGQLSVLRTGAIWKTGGPSCTLPEDQPDAVLDPFLRGYAELLQHLANP